MGPMGSYQRPQGHRPRSRRQGGREMKTKRLRIVLAVLLVAMIGGLAWLASRQREPMYQGQPLSYWLGGYDSPPLTNVTPSQADAAVRQLGTNAFPVLLRRLQQRDSK